MSAPPRPTVQEATRCQRISSGDPFKDTQAMKRACLPVLFILSITSMKEPAHSAAFETGLIPADHIALPATPPSGAVFLFSYAAGWSAADDALAQRLVDRGVVVVGIDLPRYIDAIARAPGDCVYLVSDIERLTRQAMRAAGATSYHPPILAGSGEAGGLVLGIAAQTPASTIGGTIAVDPTATFPSARTLCTGASRKATPVGMVYDLTKGDLPNPIHVIFTPAAPADGRSHIDDLLSQGFGIKASDSTEDAQTALEVSLAALVGLSPQSQPKGTPDLPIVELPAKPAYDTVAIVYSGDGGWRDIDRSIASVFQVRGVPTIGVDSLRYFWSEKKPQEIAQDLRELMATYTVRWNAKHVMLVGYSFGADILPATYNALGEADRELVAQISLLGFSQSASFEISVADWLGASGAADAPTMADVTRIDPKLMQCFYGAEETDTACPQLVDRGAEVIKTTGGHHFDGDYTALAARILDGLVRRLNAGAKQ